VSIEIKRTSLATEQIKQKGETLEMYEKITSIAKSIENGTYKPFEIIGEDTYEDGMYAGCDHIKSGHKTERIIFFKVLNKTIYIFSEYGHPPMDYENYKKSNPNDASKSR
jgi:hypothetical protein